MGFYYNKETLNPKPLNPQRIESYGLLSSHAAVGGRGCQRYPDLERLKPEMDPYITLYGGFPILGVPLLGVPIRRAMVGVYIGVPLFRESTIEPFDMVVPISFP